ncbi:MAG: hypothetical protein KBG10_04320 [Anaerolineaceae bacterium]|nr:hypothetical protein [Anaerolineaceae bacterium]
MKKRRFSLSFLAISLILSFLLGGCVTVNPGLTPAAPPIESQVPVPDSATKEPEIKVATSVPEPSQPLLTEDAILNMLYDSALAQAPVPLVNGRFSGEINGMSLTAVVEPGIAFGDLNQDGIPDGALLIAENAGGSGTFVSLLVVYSWQGQFVVSPAVTIDDRPVINSMTIDEGVVKLSALVHAPNDPMVSPSTSIQSEYRLFGASLVQSQLVSAFAGSAEHRIIIEAPVEGEQVQSAFNLRGSMPVGPFENTLKLTILDESGNVLLEEGFMVQAEDMGLPALFDSPVVVPEGSAGTRLLVTLSEISMADGKPMAVESVMVIRQ